MLIDRLPISVLKSRLVPDRWDVVAIALVFALLVYLGEAAHGLTQPLAGLEATPISLDPWKLIGYSARSALRMLIAMIASLVFTFSYATLAAKSRRAEAVLVPLLDILQSVPILGFISVTVVFFLSLTPGRVAGAEFAAIFAIFTSQAWNMAFSFYQSLRSVPDELDEVARGFRLGAWMRFWRLEVPFATPPLIWNMMMSMSGGWFFVVASEAISVGNTTLTLPGIGSYIALAIEQRNLVAIGWAIGAMFVVILVYDQLLFRPLIASADWFTLEQEAGLTPSRSWVLTMLRRSRVLRLLRRAFAASLRSASRWGQNLQRPRGPRKPVSQKPTPAWVDPLWYAAILLITLAAILKISFFVHSGVTTAEIGHVVLLGLATLARVIILIALASIVWVPIGVAIGLRPSVTRIVQPIAQFLAAFPANLFFPVVVSGIVAWHLSPNIWLSPLMILGTQWYILFNVIVGASSLAPDLRNVAENLHIRGWLWWSRIALPAIFPYYLTGAITASGGSWNAAIVAELATWGKERLVATGLGAYIAEATTAGDARRTVLGILVMSLFVVLLNRLFWRPLYAQAERRFRMA
ncbi:MAG TPA: ABC transporter permease subunit [Steroidobacteraceae bacterium]|jgi:NitT/TauT family transport system permease protein